MSDVERQRNLIESLNNRGFREYVRPRAKHRLFYRGNDELTVDLFEDQVTLNFLNPSADDHEALLLAIEAVKEQLP